MATKKADAPQSERIVKALTARKSPLRDQAVSVFLDFVLDQPFATWLDTDDAVELVVAAATGPNAALYVERHVRPGWDRHVARCEESGDTLGNAIPHDVKKRIVRLLTTTRPPRGAWARDAVDPKLVRELFAPVLQDFLLGFARRLPIPGIAGGGGGGEGGGSRSGFGLRSMLKETVEKRAGAFVEAGKSVLGGLSAEVERQIQSAARDFSESAGRDLRAALVKRLESVEGRRLLTDIVTQAVDHALATPLSAMNEDVNALPWDDIWALVPPIVEHNRDRDPVVEAVRAEIAAALEVDGERSLRDLLEEAGTLDLTVAKVLDRADGIAKALFASDGFAGWLDALLEV